MNDVALAIRAALVVIFCIAAFRKIRTRSGFREFSTSLTDLGFFRGRIATAAAFTIVTIEGGTALLMAAPPVAMVGLAIAVSVLGAFTCVASYVALSDRRVLCRCFGVDGGQITLRHAAWNATLMGCALGGFLAQRASHVQSFEGAGVAGVAAIFVGTVIAYMSLHLGELKFILSDLVGNAK
jgi:Methylamine utilisation protein MauE